MADNFEDNKIPEVDSTIDENDNVLDAELEEAPVEVDENGDPIINVEQVEEEPSVPAAETAAKAVEEAEEGLEPEGDPVPEPDIQDLYYDYIERNEGAENNRYFRYLYDMVTAGTNQIHQTNQIMHKVVDESWLTTIEDSLDAINRIIDKPRKFIKTLEEVVPVGLAKKITADSVKHLTKNTQFIVSEPGEPVQPTRILNVSLEETYDLYENRFVYHLIQRLVRFIDKRTDVIFWATGDEKRNKVVFESHVDDAYEQIEYKMEMTIKNLTSFADNDTDNMVVFARIDRVRRLVSSLRNSSFCSIMKGCTMVRSPIQRTNLMIKDPDYRTCYRLWHFLENYDGVGYTIEVRDDAMAFDQEYVNQMYSNLVNQYTVFKSLIEEDDRELNDELRKTLAEKNKTIEPKFIKEIHEEIVEDRNLPDVEIRRVFVEEVTQAQLDAEAKAEEALEAQKKAEAAKERAVHRMNEALHSAEEAGTRAVEAERQANETQRLLEEAREEANTAIQEKDKILEDTREAIHRVEVLAEEKALKNQEEAEALYKANIDLVQKKADKQVAEMQSQVDGLIAERTRELEEKVRISEEELAKIQQMSAEKCEEAEQSVKRMSVRVDLAEQLKNSAEERAFKKISAVKQELDTTTEELNAAASKRDEYYELLRDAAYEMKNLMDTIEKQKAQIDEMDQRMNRNFVTKLINRK